MVVQAWTALGQGGVGFQHERGSTNSGETGAMGDNKGTGTPWPEHSKEASCGPAICEVSRLSPRSRTATVPSSFSLNPERSTVLSQSVHWIQSLLLCEFTVFSQAVSSNPRLDPWSITLSVKVQLARKVIIPSDGVLIARPFVTNLGPHDF